jgi:tetratricopeptide (TPR) repeat protein
LDEDPGNPRYYEHLGYLYEREGKKGDALEAWKTGLALDIDRETCCGKKYYQQKVWHLTREDFGCITPDYNGAISVLEETIENDPGIASLPWLRQIIDMYKEMGDLEGARR